jgi:hypothetical protein
MTQTEITMNGELMMGIVLVIMVERPRSQTKRIPPRRGGSSGGSGRPSSISDDP